MVRMARIKSGRGTVQVHSLKNIYIGHAPIPKTYKVFLNNSSPNSLIIQNVYRWIEKSEYLLVSLKKCSFLISYKKQLGIFATLIFAIII